jgi:cell division protein FtsB
MSIESFLKWFPRSKTNQVQGVDYSRLAALLIEAVKAQQAELQSQKAEIQQLKARIEGRQQQPVD